MDETQPLVWRMEVPTAARGRRAGQRLQAVTKLQRAATLLLVTDRTEIEVPSYPEGLHLHPTGEPRLSKKEAAEKFRDWKFSEVFDIEATGAWRGLELALKTVERREAGLTYWVGLDNTVAIRGLRGRSPTTSQWAFREFHKAAEQHDVCVKWCPGHMGILGNEAADEQAKEGTKARRDPNARPTATGIKSIMKRILQAFRNQH